MAGLQWRGGVLFRMPRRGPRSAVVEIERMTRKKKMAVVQLGDGRRNIFRAVWRLRPFYDRGLEGLLQGAAAVSTLRAHYGNTDCSYGNDFAPAFTIGKHH